MHSRIKHIDIQHRFIHDLVQKDDICVEYMNTHDHIADIFTKSLPLDRFEYLRNKLGLLSLLF